MKGNTAERKEAVTILYKGGRLGSWHQLDASARAAYEQQHVALMLAVARAHGLRRLEGFRLITPQGNWERFWLIEFPDLPGAEAWMRAEMAPPYGLYGYYGYRLARPCGPPAGVDWPADTTDPVVPLAGDPSRIPALAVDRSSVVVLHFAAQQVENPGVVDIPRLARAHDVARLECFLLLAPGSDWGRLWLAELPALAAAEAWVEALASASQTNPVRGAFQLARKWAPAYFASWIPA